MKALTKNYTAVEFISDADLQRMNEKLCKVGEVNYDIEDVTLHIGKHNTDSSKGFSVFILFKNKPKYITNFSELPDSLLIKGEGNTSLVKQARLGIKEGKIVM